MGRTNGKLKSFLMDGLQNNLYPNLNWEDQNAGIFSLKLPRYERRKELEGFEKILIHWYITNNRNYPGYSGAKAVIQAALKKSVYLICLNTNSNELRFRFATKTEEQEKRMKQKHDSNLINREQSHESSLLEPVSVKPEMAVLYGLDLQSFPIPSPSPPLSFPSISSPQLPPPLSPSLSTSSGYQSGSPVPSNFSSISSPQPPPPLSPSSGYQSGSPAPSNFSDQYGNEEMIDGISLSQEANLSQDADIIKALEDLFENPQSYIKALDDITKDIEMDTIPNDIEETSIAPQGDAEPNGAEFNPVPVQFPEKPVVELIATEVEPLQKSLPWYWLCTKKLYLGSTLLLICERQDIQDESKGISPEEICLNNVLEPGVSYNLGPKLEFDGKCFLFLLRNN